MMCLIITIYVYWWSGKIKEQETSAPRMFDSIVQATVQKLRMIFNVMDKHLCYQLYVEEPLFLLKTFRK